MTLPILKTRKARAGKLELFDFFQQHGYQQHEQYTHRLREIASLLCI